MTTALEADEGSASRPGCSLPPGKTRYPLYRRLGGPQGRSGQVRKISPPLGFDPWTVHPVAGRYTDYATWPVLKSCEANELLSHQQGSFLSPWCFLLVSAWFPTFVSLLRSWIYMQVEAWNPDSESCTHFIVIYVFSCILNDKMLTFKFV
jgi:hypothetical protein